MSIPIPALARSLSHEWLCEAPTPKHAHPSLCGSSEKSPLRHSFNPSNRYSLLFLHPIISPGFVTREHIIEAGFSLFSSYRALPESVTNLVKGNKYLISHFILDF